MKVSKLVRMILASLLVLGLVGSPTAQPAPVMIEALAPIVPGMRAALADGSVIYVDVEATGVQDGTSWENAYTTLQPALEDASGGEEIWVAEGTYTPTYLSSPGDPRSATFQLENGVALYGGFDPTVSDTGWEDRDWVNNETILSGDIGNAGDPGDNSYHVFYHPSELALDGSAVLDGFTISGGNADADSSPNDYGGGMRNDSSSPSVSNCVFSGNSAFMYGAGMYNEYSSPVVTNCVFLGNSEGGMANEYSSPVVTDCTFSGNSGGAGSGMHNNHSSPVVTGCTFSGNTAALGAGMSNHNASSPTVTHCTFSDNTAYEGGGMFSYDSSPTVTNCTFVGNSAHSGGGIYNFDSSPTVTNCSFSNNSVTTGGGMYNYGASYPTVTNSILWGDQPNEISNSGLGRAAVSYSDIQGSYEGTGNIDADPLFVDAGSGDLHLLRGSPCIDTGSNSPAGGLPDYDFEGDPRVLDGNGDGMAIVDIGGDEALAILGVIYVDRDAGGNNNGTSWEDAFTSLQPALEDAAAGNEIWVAAGTYTPTYLSSPGDPRSATFQLKNGVALFGGFDPSLGDGGWEARDWGANPTILSGDIGTTGEYDDNSYHIFYHPSASTLDSTAVLDGFAVIGGNANGGDEHNEGGGMYNLDSSPTVANCTFAGNSATWDGGGMWNYGSSPAVRNCTFLDNSAGDHGGGLYSVSSSSAVTDSTFSGNSAGVGGGMYTGNSSSAVTNCIFSGNSAGHGGGMANVYSSPAVTNCTFSGNWTTWDGGGIHNHGSSPAVTNCTFSGNTTSGSGGGIYNFADSSPTLTNCSFSGNSAGNGGAIHNYHDSMPTVTNCILWEDSPVEIYTDETSQPMVTYSDVQGGYDGIGNIDADPLFLDPTSGDYHLGPGSPCIDAGDKDAPNLPPYDFEGDDRVMDGDGDWAQVVDMGIDEVLGTTPHVIYVDQDAGGDDNGTSWEDAYTTLQPALEDAARGEHIWVAAGTYIPNYLTSPGDARSATFQLKNGVGLYGGFDPSGGDVEWVDRDWANNVTILSGDIGIAGNASDNSYHVFYHPRELALDTSAVLDGFTISDGEGSESGGGMYNVGSSPSVANCTFAGNSADYGGGIYNYDSSPMMINCIFSNNSAGERGGGMYNSSSSPAVIDCTFSGNATNGSGGGMYTSNSFSAVTNCIFWGNSAGGSGGGMANVYSRPVVTNCTFSGNTAGSGGGMHNHGSSLAVTNCTFSGNSASDSGGGMHNFAESSPKVTNCTFWGNSAGDHGGGLHNYLNSMPVVTNCILWGDTAGGLPEEIFNDDTGSAPAVSNSDIQGGYSGTENLDAIPMFVDPDHGDFHLSPGSPCIDAGDNDAPNLPDFDFDGDYRVLDGDRDGTATVDMGVDEVLLHVYLPVVLRVY